MLYENVESKIIINFCFYVVSWYNEYEREGIWFQIASEKIAETIFNKRIEESRFNLFKTTILR